MPDAHNSNNTSTTIHQLNPSKSWTCGGLREGKYGMVLAIVLIVDVALAIVLIENVLMLLLMIEHQLECKPTTAMTMLTTAKQPIKHGILGCTSGTWTGNYYYHGRD